jgi:hypothetical protein
MRLLLAALALAGALAAAPVAAASRAQRHWGGSDLPVTCATVREWRGLLEGLSAPARADLARRFKVTRKQLRQARACLRG